VTIRTVVAWTFKSSTSITSQQDKFSRGIIIKAFPLFTGRCEMGWCGGRSARHASFIPTTELETAQAIVKLYRTPTPFKGRKQAGVTLPTQGNQVVPSPRRPTFEDNPELGYPPAWVAGIEGTAAAKRTVKKELDLFKTLVGDLRAVG
jgi:hypothetical protein